MTLLITRAVVWSGGKRLDADAVLIEGDRIAAVGDEQTLRTSLDTDHIDEIDAGGGLVTGSFADAHVHAVEAGVELLSLDLSDAGDADECLARIAEHAATEASATGGWITGGGWSMPHFAGGTPASSQLDAVTGDRPAFLVNADHHGAWVNSAALRIAGVDESTPDPSDGRIERDPDGGPSGTLHEGAMDLVARVVPPTEPARRREGLTAAASTLRALGITAWQEALVGDYGTMTDASPVYRAVLDAGDLDAHVTGALWVPRDTTVDGVDALVASFVERRTRNAESGFTTSTAKIMVDGVAENETAAMHEPYLVGGCTCGTNRGIAYFSRDVLFAVARGLVAQGFALHFHAIGDRAVTDALDAVEQARPHETSPLRHHIAHVQVVDPRDVPRFAALGVTVNAQALWACNEEQMRDLTLPIIGERRAAWQYPFGSFLRTGATLAMGSDWPVSTPDPWQAIHVAVNRVAPDADAEPLNPDEAITLADALLAYTEGSHRLLGFERAGVVVPGARADLAIADRDPFAGSAADIHRTRNAVTIFGGRVVHDARVVAGQAG